ncbi:MAG: amidase [Deltaproteobacteria bacterium]|nr:amidase [Deltaproteobacteria bacterium]
MNDANGSRQAHADPALHELTALEQARRIREGALRSEELVAHYLERIARLDGGLSAFVAHWPERALTEARKKDRERGRRPLPPFHGVPIAVKDTHALRGARMGLGSRAFSWLYSPIDDVTVRTLRRAGFVLVGKTATSELALLPIVEPATHPPTRNPWDATRSAGGSSGGAGAAVAARLLPLAPGSDGAGSIRIPASFGGLVGHKPSRGLVPNPHDHTDRLRMTVIGPIARDVDDAAALLDVLVSRGDAPTHGFLELARRGVPPMTVGVMTRAPLGETGAEEAAAVEEAAREAEALGHRLVRLEAPTATLDEFVPIYQRLLAAVPVPLPLESRLEPLTRWFRAEGRKLDDATVRRLFDALVARALRAFEGVDVALLPTVPVAPPKVGLLRGLSPEEGFRAVSPLGACTAAFNLSGAPALTLPWRLSALGLPLGVQLVGRLGEDARVLAFARALEARRAAPPGQPPVG